MHQEDWPSTPYLPCVSEWSLQNIVSCCSLYFEPLPVLILPHFVVPAGGRLFETFLEMMGTPESYKSYRMCCRNGNNSLMTDAEYATVLRREKGSFHGFVITACGNISTKLRRQRFYITFVARYHGLSRKGIELLGHFGLLVKITTFDIMQKNALHVQEQVIR
jgi:hypothetical protein